jgi:hypothetical protein
VSLAEIFSVVEDSKERLGIVEYSVSQPTLEQVFISIAKEGDRVGSGTGTISGQTDTVGSNSNHMDGGGTSSNSLAGAGNGAGGGSTSRRTEANIVVAI